jgi:hypothetical protein
MVNTFHRTALFTACLLIFFHLTPQAQVVKYSNDFLSIGTGARLMGMGGAGAAIVDDATSAYWNPSRLVSVNGKVDASLMHSEYFAGLAKYDYAGAAFRIDNNSYAALSVIRFGVDDIPNTLELVDEEGNVRYDRISSFSSADLAILGSFARKTNIEGLNVGGSVKIIYRHTGDFARAFGFGLDASASYAVSGWQFGLILRDVTGTFNAWSFNQDLLKKAFDLTGNELPDNSLEITMPGITLAAARMFRLNEKWTVNPAVDIRISMDGRRHVLLPLGPLGLDPYAGAEFRFSDWLFLRAGAGNFQWVTGLNGKGNLNLRPSLGIGIQYRGVFIDYAINGFSDLALAGYSNLISLRYHLK